jgi:hypothetical protein
MHIVGLALDVVPIFRIVVGVDIIKGATNKVCNFVSIGVRPLYITSS